MKHHLLRFTEIRKNYWWMQIALMALGYVGLTLFMLRISRLPVTSYNEPWLLLEFVKNLGRNGLYLMAFIPAIVVFTYRFRLLWVRWSWFNHGNVIRVLVVTAAFLVGWTFSTYEYNYYFDQWHYYDRLLLMLLFALLCLRPIFVFPFLVVLMTVGWQTSLAPGWFLWAHVNFPLNLLFLFAAYFFLALVCEWKESKGFLLLCLVIGGAHYWQSGTAKISLGWLMNDHVQLLLPATYANGWLGFLSPEQIGSITNTIGSFNTLLKWLAILAECLGPILLFWGRKSAMAVLGFWVLFHIGVLGLSGIFFWQWIGMCMCLLLLLWKTKFYEAAGMHSNLHRALGILLVVVGPFWVRSTALSWINSNVTYVYRFEAIGVNERAYSLPPRFFLPFEFPFTMGNFSYLSNEPTFNVSWGATNLKTELRLREMASSEDVLALEQEIGESKYDEAKSKLLEVILQRFISNVNEDRDKRLTTGFLAPPPLLWTFDGENAYRGQEPIERVKISQELWYYDGEIPRKIRSSKVFATEIPQENHTGGELLDDRSF